MAREEELKRVDLKVNVSCCEGCRRKVMKAISLKGVLRTEINPSLDKVTVVGDVDSRVLVKKLSKVGKIAEVMAPPPPQAASLEEGKKSDASGGGNGGDKPAAPADEKNARKDEGKDGNGDKAAAACTQECSKCTAGKEGTARADEGDGAGGKMVSKDSAAKSSDGDGLGAKSSAPNYVAAAAADYQYHHHYNRPEPAMVVPIQLPYYAANATPYYAGGYYAMPPPPPMAMPTMFHRRPQLRPQPSRFDEDFFNEDNTVGCHVM